MYFRMGKHDDYHYKLFKKQEKEKARLKNVNSFETANRHDLNANNRMYKKLKNCNMTTYNNLINLLQENRFNYNIFELVKLKEHHTDTTKINKLLQYKSRDDMDLLFCLMRSNNKTLIDKYFVYLTSFPFKNNTGLLHIACEYGNLGHIVTLLNKNICSINDKMGEINALSYLFYNKLSTKENYDFYQSIIVFLIRQGLRVPANTVSYNHMEKFEVSVARYGNMSIMNEILKYYNINYTWRSSYFCYIAITPNCGKSLLYNAIEYNNLDVAYGLLNNELIDVNIGHDGQYGYNPLKLAFEKNYHSIVTGLIEKGCKSFSNDISILTCALLTKNDQLVQSLLDKNHNILKSINELSSQNKIDFAVECIIKYNLPQSIIGYILLNNNLKDFLKIIDTVDLDEPLPIIFEYNTILDMMYHKIGFILNGDNSKQDIALFLQTIVDSLQKSSYSFQSKLNMLSNLLQENYIDEEKYDLVKNTICTNITKEKLIEEICDTNESLQSYCFICMINKPIYFNNECGHIMFCTECRTDSIKQIKTCPYCRTNINKLIKLHK